MLAKLTVATVISVASVIMAGCGPKDEPIAAPSTPPVKSAPTGATKGLSSGTSANPAQTAPEAPKAAPVTQ